MCIVGLVDCKKRGFVHGQPGVNLPSQLGLNLVNLCYPTTRRSDIWIINHLFGPKRIVLSFWEGMASKAEGDTYNKKKYVALQPSFVR